jgi:hypothetical protein
MILDKIIETKKEEVAQLEKADICIRFGKNNCTA